MTPTSCRQSPSSIIPLGFPYCFRGFSRPPSGVALLLALQSAGYGGTDIGAGPWSRLLPLWRGIHWHVQKGNSFPHHSSPRKERFTRKLLQLLQRFFSERASSRVLCVTSDLSHSTKPIFPHFSPLFLTHPSPQVAPGGGRKEAAVEAVLHHSGLLCLRRHDNTGARGNLRVVRVVLLHHSEGTASSS